MGGSHSRGRVQAVASAEEVELRADASSGRCARLLPHLQWCFATHRRGWGSCGLCRTGVFPVQGWWAGSKSEVWLALWRRLLFLLSGFSCATMSLFGLWGVVC